MNNLKDLFEDMFGIKNIDKISFKEIEINQNKIIYFAFKERQVIVNEKLTSGSIEPICFILRMDDEYYYCPLNNEKIDKKIIEEFLGEFIF